jgi:putative ABC transport system permease protein
MLKNAWTEIALVFKLFRHDASRQRKRIALTVLAIAWGTLSIVLLLSFGEGMKRAFHKGSRGMGEGIGVVWAGATSKPYMGLPSGRVIQFRDDDAAFIRDRVPEIALISPEYSKRVPVTAGTKNINARVRGVEACFGEMRNLIPQPGGRFLNEEDVAQKRRVVFIGDELAQDLFGTQEVVGKTVLINQSPFLVVGVMEKKIMMGMYSGPDAKQAAIPATSFKAIYTDQKPGNIVYKPRSMEVDADRAKTEIYRVLGLRNHFDPDDEPALGIWDTRENQKVTVNLALGIQIFLGIIGTLTLLVGGMGVANIMYAVVKERTREIGVKMALGAKVRQVMAPFVLEALFMTVIGGILGTAVSLGLMMGIAALPLKGEAFEFLGRPTFSPAIALATSTVLGAVGTLSGYFPARRAASVNPAVSLRYE